ncbi:MAG: hypothetical protein HOM14_03945 [Gammaproteobacteria bacterium]|jgi:hypothetical protein|nr:hypothetical protein [Gammaproteobacteria bacterium]MBT3722575.1 hypothetical protein [Gammaproteobacteria bacterium]MBT4076784.1 hypothetical protein [Gammaproteobacteria bacterium]MBT4193195.1 hypothetical protein [Gammaproteobacteria bacterium]MBT4451094.1 hypothetical protein [Gammaproteobacteria bacterium]
MNIPRVKIYSLLVLLLLFTPNVIASAETDFNQGVKFFRSGDYAAAVVKFKSASEQGLNNVSLYYNLASSYYKLNRFEASKKYFKKVSLFENLKDLADYNLGLIALKQNNKDQARLYFSSVSQSGTDQKLVKLATKKLSSLGKKSKPLQVYLSANVGYSDNVDSTPDDVAAGISDTYYDVFLSVESSISGQRKDGWLVGASLFSLDYTDNDNYDESQLSFGVKKEQKLSGWDSAVIVNLEKNTLASEDYLSTLKLEFKARKSLSKSTKLYFRYRYEDIGSEDLIYDYLEGSRQRGRVEYRAYNTENIKQIYYELELNSRGYLESTDDAYDYSATRHTLRGKYTKLLNKKWRLNGDLSYRFSSFPVSDTLDRQDDRWKLAVSADYRINKTFKWVSKLQFVNNVSTVDRYNYDNVVFNVGLTKLY